ncbi:MAG: DamX protein [Bermanella sp.]|jgi:DamX protein
MTNVTPIPILVGERIQQLDMLMHIQEFSSMVAVVTGDAGMGKTALVESAASQLSIHHQVISFSAAEIQSEVDVVEFISQQLGIVDSWSAIEQSLIDIHAQSESVNVLIDDAHLLAYELLSMLCTRAIQEDGWHLVLAGDDTLFKKLTHIQQDLHHTNLIHHLDLAAIAEEEAVDLAAEYFKRDGHESVPLSRQKLTQLWQVSNGAPGALIDLIKSEQQQGKVAEAKFPFGHVAAICLIAVALTFSYLYQDDSSEQIDMIDSIIASQAKVDNSLVVNKPIVAIEKIRQVKVPVIEQTVSIVPVIELEKVVENTKAINSEAVNKSKAPQKKSHPLLSAPSDGFGLQLLGVRSKSSAMSVLNDFKGALGDDKLSVYETSYKGQPWFVVVYGPISDKVAANQKANGLAKRLNNQPWVRPMAKIQEDIRKIQP